MSFSEFEQKRYEKIVGEFVEKRRPAPDIRNQVDLAFRIDKQSVEIFEIRARRNKPDEKFESPIAKATYVKTKDKWQIYWQRADLKWHRYDPMPEVNTIEEYIAIVEKDECSCFWG
jgi:hypothetical protein